MFIDTLLNCRWVIPIVPQNFVLERVSIAIHNKRIIAICEQSEASHRFEPSVTYALDRHLVLPGLINSHTYASLNVLAKIIFEQSNQSWFGTLPQVLAEYPVSPQLISDATQIAVAEMIKVKDNKDTGLNFRPSGFLTPENALPMTPSLKSG